MSNPSGWQEKFEAIGTHWTIDIFDAPDGVEKGALFSKIHSRINEFDLV